MELSAKIAADGASNTLGERVRLHGAATPEKVAISFNGRNTTYRELCLQSDQVANGLRSLGVESTDRVAILDKNTDRFFEIWLGVSKLNGVIVPINARLAGPEIDFVINDAKIKVLFIGEPFVQLIDSIRDRLTSVKKVIVVNEGYETWRDGFEAAQIRCAVSEDDVMMQLYTSGTTGNPKGVQLTHRNVLNGVAETLESWGNWTASDIALIAMPLFHIAGCGIGMLSLVGGLRLVVLREFVPSQVIELIQKERTTVAFLVPSMIMFLLDDESIIDADLSSMRRIVYGASPMPSMLLQRALKRFTSTGFVQIYGLTETTGAVTVLSPEDHLEPGHPRLKSCGRAIRGVELRIVGANGKPVPQGNVGEIACRTEKNMKGYWNRDEDNARTIRDGWLYTGDAGYVDAEGYLYIHDRVKDMIVSGGENIYPAEVESAMFGHPSIADIAVIGVPDSRWGEAVKAVIVLKPDAASDGAAADILAYTRERLAGYKIPKSIDFVTALPRNPTGKVLKRELREKYWRGYERRVN